MKSYIITTGVLFALITIAHIWRMIVAMLGPVDACTA
jgi:hypothetical protein